MPLENIFETKLYWVDLDLDNEEIISTLSKFKAEEPKPWMQTCLTSFFTDRNLHKHKKFAKFSNAISEEIREYCNRCDADLDNYSISIKEMWYNTYKRGHGQESHIHPGSHISGIYCVEGDDTSAKTAFQSPLADLEMLQFPFKNAVDTVLLKAVPGRLILFRSWLRHLVTTHESDNPRTTISLNINLVPKNNRFGGRKFKK